MKSPMVLLSSVILSAASVFAGHEASAADYAYLMKLDCRFENGVRVSGVRGPEKNAWAPFPVLTAWGFSGKYMSAYLEPHSRKITLRDPIPGTDKEYVYMFTPEHKPGLKAKEAIPGVLVGPTGKTSGVCEMELQDHS